MPAQRTAVELGCRATGDVPVSGTICENLIAGSPDSGFVEMVEACRLAGIHDVIEQLPKGYNTVIGEHGAGLSGGQKQRLAIARAVLKNPRILVFDEATSSLDEETAERFAGTVNALRGRMTVLFIAHRVPKGLRADRTVRLDGMQRSVACGGNERSGAPAG